MSAPTKWTPEADAVVREMWAEGISTMKIAARLCVTKNSVIGRVGRLGLTRRDNPSIPRTLTPRKSRSKPAHLPRTVLPARPAPAPVVVIPQPVGVHLACGTRVGPSEPVAVSAPLPPAPAPSLWRTCQWPTGDKGEQGIRFLCTDKPTPGRPYCGFHCSIAFEPHVARWRAA